MYSFQVQSIADRPLIDAIANDDFMLIGDASSGGVVKRVLISTLVDYVASQIEVTPVDPPVAQSLYSPSLVPTDLNDQNGGATYELGQRLQFARIGQIKAIRYYKANSETGTHIGRIWSESGTLLTSVTFVDETASGWQEQALAVPFEVEADTEYMISVNTNGYWVVTFYPSATVTVNGDISGQDIGRYGATGAYPTSSSGNNYFRDVVFE